MKNIPLSWDFNSSPPEPLRFTWNPRWWSYLTEYSTDRKAAGVVQQTNKTTIEINTTTSILSSALCSVFFLRVLRRGRLASSPLVECPLPFSKCFACGTSKSRLSRLLPDDGSGDGVLLPPTLGTASRLPLVAVLPPAPEVEDDCPVEVVLLLDEGCGEQLALE